MKKNKSNNEIVDFFKYVRSIERAALNRCRNDENVAVLLGEDGPPKYEAIKFKGVNNFAFPGVPANQPILKKNSTNDGSVASTLAVSFMGISGVSGILPQHYTRLIMSRSKQHDTTLADFLDLFNHRLVSLYYRSWLKYRFPLQYENSIQSGNVDPVSKVIKSISGKYDKLSGDLPIYYAGHFSRMTRSTTSLEHILRDFLKVPVVVKSFTGQWIDVQKKDRAVIGTKVHGRNNQLGHGVLFGKRYWDVQSKISIDIGAVDEKTNMNLMAGKQKYNILKRLILNYVPSHISIDLNISVLRTSGSTASFGKGMRLSEIGWLCSSNSRPELKRVMHLSRVT